MQAAEHAGSFRVPGYRFLWFAGFLWHVARWVAVFSTTFRVNEQTGNPLLVQLVGSSFMAPMFLGGALAGTITDRFDRARIIRTWLTVLVPLAGLMALAVAGNRAPVAVSYAFVFCIGIGNVLDMTSRRSLAFGVVGAGLVTNAAAYETMALHAGTMVGTIAGGALLEAFPAEWAYGTIGLIYLVAITVVGTGAKRAGGVPSQPSSAASPAGGRGLGAEYAEAIGLLRTQPVLRQFLVITVLMNFFFYAFTPLVPVFAEDLGVGAFLTGLLAAAVGAGSMLGAMVIARIQPSRRGLVHIIGSGGAMTMLIVFANISWYPGALLALFAAGLLGSGFGATQSALVISLVDEAVRGRALGVLSMAIGALPFGMFSLGLIARRTDPQLAVTVSVGVGLALLVLWQARRPHLRELA